jgi:hypothetical protein
MRSKILVLLCVTLVLGCNNGNNDAISELEETAQQIGDVMASIDEAGGSSGNIASLQNSIQKTFQRHAPEEVPHPSLVASVIIPKAHAASCFTVGVTGTSYSACTSVTNGSITKTFNNCSIGTASLSGDITFAWTATGTQCAMDSVNEQIERNPNFVLTGRRGATLTVTKTGGTGQVVKLTNLNGGGANRIFEFTNGGINRKFTNNGTTLFDNTTTTTLAITITGSDRTNRALSGGSLRIANNLKSITCDYVPTNVTWAGGTCNCPTSGSWAGTCSNGKTTTLNITGCGTGSYTEGSDTISVVFDRCGN